MENKFVYIQFDEKMHGADMMRGMFCSGAGQVPCLVTDENDVIAYCTEATHASRIANQLNSAHEMYETLKEIIGAADGPESYTERELVEIIYPVLERANDAGIVGAGEE